MPSDRRAVSRRLPPAPLRRIVGMAPSLRPPAVAVAVLAASAALASAQAPRRPPEPFPVFVHATETDDAERAEAIAAALVEVREGVQRRRNWFRLTDDREEAALTLRVTSYRHTQQMRPKLDRQFINGQLQIIEGSEVIDVHYVDAVASAPGSTVRGSLSGFDERERGSSLQNAARHLAELFEDFVKEHYQAVTSREPSGWPMPGARPGE